MLPDERKNDPEIVLAAVQWSGWAIGYASCMSFENDPKIVLVAVQRNGEALGVRFRVN